MTTPTKEQIKSLKIGQTVYFCDACGCCIASMIYDKKKKTYFVKNNAGESGGKVTMAEERILIQKIEPECKFREKNTDTIAGEKKVWFKCCKFNKRTTCEEDDFIHCKKKELIGLSRQEAIERMAKAMCHRFAEGCEECKSCGLSCKDYLETEGYMSDAEAALNALLEGK